MTLSCADLRWNDLAGIISKLYRLGLIAEAIESMNYFDRSNLLNKNPVIVGRHIQYRVEVFFTEIIRF